MSILMHTSARLTQGEARPVVRISKGHFAPGKYDEVERLIRDSANLLAPAIQSLQGLLYYHAGADRSTNTIVNVSIWESEQAARQIETLAPMLAQRPILEAAGVRFDEIANYTPMWKLEAPGIW